MIIRARQLKFLGNIPISWLDLIILILMVGFLLYFVVSSGGLSGQTASVLVIKTPEKVFEYTLNKDEVIEVSGVIGKMHIEVKDGRARVIDAPCRDKTCIHMGGLSKTSEFSACLPNGVFLSVKSSDKNTDIDTVIY